MLVRSPERMAAQSPTRWSWSSAPSATCTEGAPPAAGTVSVVEPDGTSRVVADDVWFPNGMAIIDGTTLVVAESHADRLTAWTITDDGALVERRVWADLGPGAAPDGTTLYIVANQWGADGAGEGVVLTQRVDVAHAGRP